MALDATAREALITRYANGPALLRAALAQVPEERVDVGRARLAPELPERALRHGRLNGILSAQERERFLLAHARPGPALHAATFSSIWRAWPSRCSA